MQKNILESVRKIKRKKRKTIIKELNLLSWLISKKHSKDISRNCSRQSWKGYHQEEQVEVSILSIDINKIFKIQQKSSQSMTKIYLVYLTIIKFAMKKKRCLSFEYNDCVKICRYVCFFFTNNLNDIYLLIYCQ